MWHVVDLKRNFLYYSQDARLAPLVSSPKQHACFHRGANYPPKVALVVGSGTSIGFTRLADEAAAGGIILGILLVT